MKNKLFYTDKYRNIQDKIKKFLNSQSDFLSPLTASSPRATGDAIQELLADNFEKVKAHWVAKGN